MAFAYYCLAALLVTVADQVSKYLVVRGIPMYETVPLLPGVLSLTHVHNDGAAFSALRGMRWLFVLIFVLFTLAVLWEYFRKPLPLTKFERVLVALVYGGGLGNLLDRVRLGYVVDMLQTEFMDFPVFNVADCFISCGCILLALHLALFNKKIWKDEKKCG